MIADANIPNDINAIDNNMKPSIATNGLEDAFLKIIDETASDNSKKGGKK